MDTIKKAFSNIVLEVFQDSTGTMHNMESDDTVSEIIGVIGSNIAKDVTYRVWHTHPTEGPVACVVLGSQLTKQRPVEKVDGGSSYFEVVGLQERPVVQMSIQVHATLVALRQKYAAYCSPEHIDSETGYYW
jgi:hypothetical protein